MWFVRGVPSFETCDLVFHQSKLLLLFCVFYLSQLFWIQYFMYCVVLLCCNMGSEVNWGHIYDENFGLDRRNLQRVLLIYFTVYTLALKLYVYWHVYAERVPHQLVFVIHLFNTYITIEVDSDSPSLMSTGTLKRWRNPLIERGRMMRSLRDL